VSQSGGPTLSHSEFRFEHYEVLTHDDGTPLELGRGAMGVTYKALDVNLRYAVALKVINARFIGDESARRRFVREARAAASVRHPNVASVFHLGKSGDSYFYAMEFVDGESLDNVIRRSGRLDPSTALKVTALVPLAWKQSTNGRIKAIDTAFSPSSDRCVDGCTQMAASVSLGHCRIATGLVFLLRSQRAFL